jgi:two-component system response regulator YesN
LKGGDPMVSGKPVTSPRKKVFYRLFVSNLIMLLLPLLVGWGMYTQLEKIIYENAYQANSILISQLRQNIDHRVKELQQLSYLISVNPKIQTLLTDLKSDNSQKDYLASELLNELRKYTQVNSIVDEFFISSDQIDSIFMPNGRMDTLFYFENYLPYTNVHYEDWIQQYVKGYSYQQFYPAMETAAGEAMLTFTSSIPLGERTATVGKLFFRIDQSKLLDSAEITEKSSTVHLYILDKDNRIVMRTSDLPLEDKLLTAVSESPSSSIVYASDKERMMITYELSKHTGWKYVVAMPEEAFIAPVLKVKYGAIVSAVACLMIGLIAAYVMTERNYSPLRNLVKVIRLKAQPTSKQGRWDEWDALKYSMEESLEEERQLRGQLHKHFPAVQSSYIHRLIRGHVESENIQESSNEMLGAPFPYNHYAVLLIDVDDCNDFVKDNSERQWAHVRFIIMNIMQDLLKERSMKGFFAEMERDQIGGLINHSLTSDEWKQAMQQCLVALKDILENRLSIFVTAAVSESRQEASQIGACYSEALQTREFKWLGHRSYIFYSDLGEVEKSYFYPVETEGQIMNLVKHAEYEQVSKLLDQVYTMNFESGAIAPELGKWLMYNIVSTLLKCLQVMNLTYKEVFVQEDDPDTRLSSCATLSEMFHEIKRMYETLCSYVHEERSDHNQELLNKMFVYLHDHVYDGMLGLESAADHFELSPKYVSRFFKLHTGQTMTDYIAKMRVEEAKKLLLETDLTILEISQKLGYSTDIGLQRIFKKHTGLTPGKYRIGTKQ